MGRLSKLEKIVKEKVLSGMDVKQVEIEVEQIFPKKDPREIKAMIKKYSFLKEIF